MTDQMIVPVEHIAGSILTLRGQRVILDADLARLYGVTTKRLNEQVKRNANRFPEDFMFQLTLAEVENLRSQNATSSSGYGGRRYLPYAFAEHGAVMAATILNSPKAIDVSIYVVRAFVQLRAMLMSQTEWSLQLERLERKLITSINLLREHDDTLTAHESEIEALIEAVNALRTPPDTPRRPIGFCTDDESA